MLTKQQAQDFAKDWIEAWNSHDLDRILAHYHETVVLVSPIAAKLLNDPQGTVNGKLALQAYFKKGLEAYPNLTFELIDVGTLQRGSLLCKSKRHKIWRIDGTDSHRNGH